MVPFEMTITFIILVKSSVNIHVTIMIKKHSGYVCHPVKVIIHLYYKTLNATRLRTECALYQTL